jgi:hypothetical protein
MEASAIKTATDASQAAESAVERQGGELTTVPLPEADKRLERCLVAMAAFSGNGRRAAKFLAVDGIEVAFQTLYRWVQPGGRYEKRYEEIRAEVLPRVRERAAEEHQELSAIFNELAKEGAEALKGKWAKMEPRDLAGAVRNVSTSSAIHTDKAALLRSGEPPPDGTKDAASVLRKLSGRGLRFEVTERERHVAVESDGDGEQA